MALIAKVTLLIGILLLVIGLFQRNSNFLDVNKIIKEHVSIFKGNIVQGLSIFLAPAIISLSISLCQTITDDIINSVVVILSIFGALFFAELSILCSLPQTGKNERYIKLLRETFNSVLFEILVSTIVLIIAVVYMFFNGHTNIIIERVVSFLIYP